ncbi:MAG: hypothetical protein JNL58_07075 [Planctomyces sp.]|nr:hypothetical protein [Planctomyces sp.]
MSVEKGGESLAQEAFEQWQLEHAGWKQLTIDGTSVRMSDEHATTFDVHVDHDATPAPEYRLSHQGETKYEGILMGNGFVDNTQLVIAIDPEGGTKVRTFKTSDGRTTCLSYRRVTK